MSRAILEEAGLLVPRGREATFDHEDEDFLAAVGELVVTPANGQRPTGGGVTVTGTGRHSIAALIEQWTSPTTCTPTRQ